MPTKISSSTEIRLVAPSDSCVAMTWLASERKLTTAYHSVCRRTPAPTAQATTTSHRHGGPGGGGPGAAQRVAPADLPRDERPGEQDGAEDEAADDALLHPHREHRQQAGEERVGR